MTPPESAGRTVRCPACGGPSLYAPENRYRPFCSARCRLHDLGDWANERFRIDAQDARDPDAPDPNPIHPPLRR
ncbi:MAG TPA: DNA gyrase inhibitor YacG [Ottowia sp.]|mgnify:CR=1 FL=1|uniref:DNA gyrase inhibitor YacG n=1 Tax=Ottowia sp. TaxID=1898956 RepID=UPI002C43AA32|nr:DNA gyrase inhibitor YacG [Ottowia sp.]HMN19873.1 DNA gyrase inhibitor YacG [Ottowia sp.]